MLKDFTDQDFERIMWVVKSNVKEKPIDNPPLPSQSINGFLLAVGNSVQQHESISTRLRKAFS